MLENCTFLDVRRTLQQVCPPFRKLLRRDVTPVGYLSESQYYHSQSTTNNILPTWMQAGRFYTVHYWVLKDAT